MKRTDSTRPNPTQAEVDRVARALLATVEPPFALRWPDPGPVPAAAAAERIVSKAGEHIARALLAEYYRLLAEGRPNDATVLARLRALVDCWRGLRGERR